MMKKYYNYMCLAILVFSVFACNKNHEYPLIDNEKPEARVAEQLAFYKKTILESTDGWMAYVFPAGTATFPRGGYTFYMKFNEAGRVAMYSDYSAAYISAKKESAYSVQITGRPSLNFDTYNYIHILADPSSTVNGGEAGRGYYSDFEFGFKNIYPDSIVFEGNLYKSKMVLKKATAADVQSFVQNTFGKVKEDIQNYAISNPFLYVNKTAGQNNTTLSFNMATRMVTFNWKDEAGVIQEERIAFATALDRLLLKGLFVNGNVSVKEIIYDKAANQLFLIDQAGNKSPIRPENNPLETFADRLAIYRFEALRLQKENQTGSGATLYNSVESSMLATGGRRLQYIEITRRAVDTVRINYRYTNSSGSGFNAYKEYILKIENSKVRFIDFPATQTGGSYSNYYNPLTGAGLRPQVIDFDNFLQNNTFDADYESGNINGFVQTLGRLKMSTNPSYFLRWNVN